MNIEQSFRNAMGALAVISACVGLGGIGAVHAAEGNANMHGMMHMAQDKDRTGVPSISRPGMKETWTCPMHAEISRHEPGKCPICKMKLVKAKPHGT